MPSPLNTPTSDQESKSIFDSIENLSQLKTTTTTTTMGIDPKIIIRNADNNNGDNSVKTNDDDINENINVDGSVKQFIINNIMDDDDDESKKNFLTKMPTSSNDDENKHSLKPSVNTLDVDDDYGGDGGVITMTKSKNTMINHSKQISSTNNQQNHQQEQNGSTMSLESTTTSLSNSTTCSSSTNLTCSSESNHNNTQTDNENDDINSWRNNSIKYRRARLNLNLVPLKNLSLPQISPTPTTLDQTFPTAHRNGSSCSTGGSSSDRNVDDCGPNGRSRSSANGNRSDYFNFSFNSNNHSYQTSCSHHHHHNYSSSSSSLMTGGYFCPTTTAILLQRPPSPKYNPKKFEPIQQRQNNDDINRWCLNFQDYNDNRSSTVSSNNNNVQQQQLRFNYQDAVRIDSNVSLEYQFWYHGSINRKESEKILEKHSIGSYLVRRNRRRNVYTLSLKSIFGYIHFRLFHCNHNNGNYWSLGHFGCPSLQQQGINNNVDDNDHPNQPWTSRSSTSLMLTIRFESIPQLIDHYTIHRLPLNGCEHMALLYPIEVQLL
ncbi:hypothetical protein DERF_009950 [Dermatophagoides farinae]|uniref:SH2 domain-containing protein n=1 Tax=Dermatophagoides farinae TaxID=6954 RepID=A0A922L217_DERFA|nr:hypothetical protein DERF_009950 [Dermatophagoides farinae]